MPNPENLKPYKPGESGNPAGRPKGSRNLSTILREMLEEDIEVNIDGVKSRKQFKEVIIRRLIKKANDGDMRAIVEILDRIDGKVAQEVDQNVSGGLNIRFEEPEEYKRVYPTQDQGNIGDLDGNQ